MIEIKLPPREDIAGVMAVLFISVEERLTKSKNMPYCHAKLSNGDFMQLVPNWADDWLLRQQFFMHVGHKNLHDPLLNICQAFVTEQIPIAIRRKAVFYQDKVYWSYRVAGQLDTTKEKLDNPIEPTI